MLALSSPAKVNFPSSSLSAALLMPESIAESQGQHLAAGRLAVLRNMMGGLWRPSMDLPAAWCNGEEC